MGQCSVGPVLVVYPDGVWYKYKTKADIDVILEKLLSSKSNKSNESK